MPPKEEQVQLLEQGKEEYIDADEYLSRVGQCGWYQVRMHMIICLYMMTTTAQIFVMYFVGHDPAWRCANGSEVCKYNTTISSTRQVSLFNMRCAMNRNDWEYAVPKQYSIVTEWDLVCENTFWALLANSIIFIGWGIGGLTLPYIADRVGRKRVFIPTAAVIMVVASVSGIVDNFYFFVCTRLVIGICQGGCQVSIFVLSSEIAGRKYRAMSGTFIWFYFAIGMVMLTYMAYFLNNWRMLEIISTAPFLLLLVTWTCIPESIRWYKVKGKTEKAEKLLRGIASLNGRAEPTAKLIPETGKLTPENISVLFTPPKMMVNTWIQMTTWIIADITYFGVSLASEDLSGNLHTDFALTSVMEVPANIAVIVFCSRFGRKKTVVTHIFLAGLACLGVAFIPLDATYHLRQLKLVLGMIGKYATTTYFNSLYVWTLELNATVVRSQAIGFFLVLSRVTGTVAPTISTRMKFIYPPLPFFIFAGLNLISGFSTMYLKETMGSPLIESIQDMHNWLGITKTPDEDKNIKK